MSSRSEQWSTNPALHALFEHLEHGTIGRLCVESPTIGSVSVYVMQGEVLAANTDRDGYEVVSRLQNGGAITPAMADRFQQRLDTAAPMGDVLFGQVPDKVLCEQFQEQFRENLARYIFSRAHPRFEPLDGVFEDNVQVGHDSLAILDELATAVGRCGPILEQNPSCYLEVGSSGPRSVEQARLLDLVEQPTPLETLLSESPQSRLRTACLVQDMLDAGVLARCEPDAAPKVPPVIGAGEQRRQRPADADPEPRSNGADAGAQAPGEHSVAPAPPKQDTDPGDSGDSGESPDLLDLSEPGEGEPEPEVLDGVDEIPADSDVEAPREEEKESAPSGPGDVHPPVQGEHSADELILFREQERARGEGQFTLSEHLLDYVDLNEGQRTRVPSSPPPAEDSEEEIVLEAGDADDLGEGEQARPVSLSFSSPTLSREDALRKIEVANSVLREICYTLDDENGPGSGQAAVQLLLEGAPSGWAELFSGVEALRGGEFSADLVFRNLQQRPASEQRSLLNRALRDLIERGLAVTAETVSEARLDAMLERIAGFQKRIGL